MIRLPPEHLNYASPMTTLFISDLHLADERPGITTILLRFLAGPARDCDALYLLGDVFEYWIGDDASMPNYKPVCQALSNVIQAGTPIFFMRGNRDFLVGEALAATTGMQLLEDPTVIDLDGVPTLLTHGDMLCTDDLKHQEFRKFALDPANQKQILSLPIEHRDRIAQGIRLLSKSNNALEAADIIDVNQQAVEDCLREYGVARMIHGHTHRPAIHHFDLNGEPAERIVLSDWHEDSGSVLVCDGQTCEVKPLA